MENIREWFYLPAAQVPKPTEGTSTVLPLATFIGKWEGRAMAGLGFTVDAGPDEVSVPKSVR